MGFRSYPNPTSALKSQIPYQILFNLTPPKIIPPGIPKNLPKLSPPGPINRARVFFPLSSLLSSSYSPTQRVRQNMFSPLLSSFHPLLSSPQGSSHSNLQNSSQNGTFWDITFVSDLKTASNVTQNVPIERDTPSQTGHLGTSKPLGGQSPSPLPDKATA